MRVRSCNEVTSPVLEILEPHGKQRVNFERIGFGITAKGAWKHFLVKQVWNGVTKKSDLYVSDSANRYALREIN